MKQRASGILLHVSSLPGPYGIGDLGPWAYRFIDFLAESKQSYWQILPLNPTTLQFGNSPYSSFSAFAGNPLLISPDLLLEESLLSRKDIPSLSDRLGKKIQFPKVGNLKHSLLEKAFLRCQGRLKKDPAFQQFYEKNKGWLEDFSLFVALQTHFPKRVWNQWPLDVRDRQRTALQRWREKLWDTIEKEQFIQYLFFKQWKSLKSYANRKKIQIIGDLPIYVQHQSADVWAHADIFKLDSQKRPLSVAGVPPDLFSATGQLWNNPLYRWDILKKTGYRWWVNRVKHNVSLFDVIRVDHFKGFVDCWEVPAGEKTALKGKWVLGPGKDFFHTLLKHLPCLPFIAEDLGIVTPELHALRDRFDLPGMRILQFAFGTGSLSDFYKPHEYIPNCVAYTGTHDNEPLMSWLFGKSNTSTRTQTEIHNERRRAFGYAGLKTGLKKRDVHWDFIRLLMMSVANTVILPMQDILGLGADSRMNRPAIPRGNWEWRLKSAQLNKRLIQRLSEMTQCYRRG